MSDEPEEQKPKAVFCFWCGKQEPSAPATWSLLSTPDRGPQLLCEACTRTNLRSIESQLSTDWW